MNFIIFIILISLGIGFSLLGMIRRAFISSWLSAGIFFILFLMIFSEGITIYKQEASPDITNGSYHIVDMNYSIIPAYEETGDNGLLLLNYIFFFLGLIGVAAGLTYFIEAREVYNWI